jgi:hypothetical protein
VARIDHGLGTDVKHRPAPRHAETRSGSRTDYDVCCAYGDHPGQSWSTGSTSYDGISSHYERLRQLNSAITGRGYNDAVSGAKMAAAPT